jgi:hypothetical protein
MFRAAVGLEASGDRAMVSDMSGAHASVSHLRVGGGRRCWATRYSIGPRARQTKVRKERECLQRANLGRQARKVLLAARTTRDAGRCRPQPKASAACMAYGPLARCHAVTSCHFLPMYGIRRPFSPFSSPEYQVPFPFALSRQYQTPTALQSSSTTRSVSVSARPSSCSPPLSPRAFSRLHVRKPSRNPRYTTTLRLRCSRPSHSVAPPLTPRLNGLSSTLGPKRSSPRLYPARRP